MSINNKALIVALNISMWGARKFDRKATDEVNKSNQASDDAGRYNKLLIPKEFIQPLEKLQSKARTYHLDNTLAWGNNGERMLSTEHYFTYIENMAKLKDEFEQEVRVFLSAYETAMNKARLQLGNLFNQSDYPSALQIESKFGFKTEFFPIPDTDFRVSLNDDEIKKLQDAVGKSINDRVNEAVAGIWERIAEQLKHMKERLSNQEAVFRNSLFENLKELIDLLPKLNITGDVNIARICNEMSSLVVDPDAVRQNTSLRSQKAQDVDKILSKFSDFLS